MATPALEVPQTPMRYRLAIALEHAHLTDVEMAAYLGVHPTTVGKWLKGRRNPKRSALIAWAGRCNVPLEWLEGPGSGSGLTAGVTRGYRFARARDQVFRPSPCLAL